MRNKLLLLGSLLLFATFAWSQTTVTGKVSDEKNLPLPLVNILVVGTSNGTLTDFEGKYTIDVNAGDQIKFSFLGYETQTLVYNGQPSLDVSMNSSSSKLDEVIVIGYGTQTKEDLVGSVASVSGTDLRKTGITNVTHMIQDALPGVMAEINSGQPGDDDASITIRGAATWAEKGNDPLILIDGIEASGGFSQIDASEIASISVLKDAASTAIYGVKGANGVILITTRRGATGRPTVTASFNVTAKSVASIPEQMNSYEVLSQGQTAYKNDGSYGLLRPQSYIDMFNDPDRNIYAYPEVDWYDLMIKKVGWEESARVNVSGGTEFVKYFAAISGTTMGDIVENDAVDGYYDSRFAYSKVNFRSNLDFNLTKSTKFNVDIAGRTESRKTPNADVKSTDFGNVFKFIDEATPYLFPAYYPAEFLKDYPDPLDPKNSGSNASEDRAASYMRNDPYQANPYHVLNYSGMRKYRKDVVDITMGLEQDLGSLVKGLKIAAKFNYSSYSSYKKKEGWEYDAYHYDAVTGEWSIQGQHDSQTYESKSKDFHTSAIEEYEESNRNIYYEAKLIYDRVFAEDHTVGAVGVFNRRQVQYKLTSSLRPSEDWVGRLTYDYKKRYYLKATAGYNGSDKFAPGYRFGFFPSASAAWNIANEPFFKGYLGWDISMLKLRYSYGKTGSENAADYLYLGGWSSLATPYGHTTFGNPMSGPLPRYAETNLANPLATWETSIKNNIGVDIVALKEDLNITIDLFNELRTGIFTEEPMPSYYHPSFGSSTGDDASIKPNPINNGEAKNHGLEVDVSYGYTLDNGMRLKVGGNLTAVESRMVYASDLPNAPEYQKEAGKPIGWQKGFRTDGYVKDFEQAINSPNAINYGGTKAGDYSLVDFNGNGGIDGQDAIPLSGTSQPLFVYGFRFGFTYKGFDFMAKFLGKEGVYYNASNFYPNFNNILLEAKTIHADTWSPSNPDARYPTYSAGTPKKYENRSDVNLMNSSYLKLNNVSVSYLLKSDFLNRTIHVNNVTLSLSGQNLYSWSTIPYGDPEGGNSISGSYGGNYPLVRRFVFDVKLNF